MTGFVEVLQWDTEFFGLPIGRVDLDGLSDDDLTAAGEEARSLGLKCVYGGLDPANFDSIDLVQDHGFRLVEVAMDLDHRNSILEHRPPTRSTARAGSMDDVPMLAEEIIRAAPWSRFAVDRRFGVEPAARMHQAWVERAARGEDGRMLIIAEDETGLTGFSTQTSIDHPEPRIDLIASSKPGSGAAQALVAFAFDLFGERRSWGGPIAARNVASLRFCENMGYRIATSRYLFHCWLDEVAS